MSFFRKTFKTLFGVIENLPSATCRLVAQPQPLLLPFYPWLAPLDGKGIPDRQSRSGMLKARPGEVRGPDGPALDSFASLSHQGEREEKGPSSGLEPFVPFSFKRKGRKGIKES